MIFTFARTTQHCRERENVCVGTQIPMSWGMCEENVIYPSKSNHFSLPLPFLFLVRMQCVNVGGRGSKSHSFCWTAPLKPCARTQRNHKHKHTCPPSSPLHTSPAASKWTPPPQDLISSRAAMAITPLAPQWLIHSDRHCHQQQLNPIRFISCFCF